MPPKPKATKHKATTKPPEFHFDLDCANSGKLTYRCMELVISGDPSNDTMSDEDLGLIEQIVDTLNEHFPHLK
jgi:hypothetical protein